jgi:hypothetical protein
MVRSDRAPPGFTAALVFDDPDAERVILTGINRRPLAIAEPARNLNRGGGQRLSFDLVKLISTGKWSPSGSTCRRTNAENAAARNSSRTLPAKHPVYSQELFEEFDVFAVQIRAPLDHVVKVIRRCLAVSGRCTRFDRKGAGVLASLKNNIARKQHRPRKSMEHLPLKREAHGLASPRNQSTAANRITTARKVVGI